ncbi:MAG: P-loop NTPase fold protein, partial [Gemmatimonadota bacterium]
MARAAAARRFTKQGRIHMEHLLIGLFTAEQSVAASWLREAGFDEDALLDLLVTRGMMKLASSFPFSATFEPDVVQSDVPITSHVERAVRRALELAGPEGPVYSEHLLQGLLSVEECSVVRALPEGVPWALARLARVHRDRGGRTGEGSPAVPPPGTDEPDTLVVVPGDEPESARVWGLGLEGLDLAPHVRDALEAAAWLAGKAPIDARAALLGAAIAPGSETSQSFERLAILLPVQPPELRDRLQSSPLPPGHFRLSAALAASLGAARERLSDLNHLWGRDWVTAALLATADPSLPPLAAEAGRTVPGLQDSWFAFVTRGDDLRSRPDWRSWWTAWWHDAGVPLPSERPVRSGYLPESVQKREDRIGIDGEVLSFARLITDRATTPPLSIGLLGDWGSGKSFFMERLHDTVEELTGTGAGTDGGRVARLIQIRFNAWHYSDANLWASLVGHLFDEIWKGLVPEETPAASRREVEQKLQKAHGALFEAEAQMDEAHDLLREAEAQVEKERRRLRLDRLLGNGKTETLETLRRVAGEAGWTEPLDDFLQAKDALATISGSAWRLRRTLELGLREYPVLRVLGWIALCIGAAAGVTLLTGLAEAPLVREAVARTATLGGIVASLVSAVAVPLARAGRKVGSFTSTLDEIVGTLTGDAGELKPEATDARGDREARERKRQLAEARRDLDRAQIRADAARERIFELEARRASLDPGRRLADFLEQRVQSEDYRSRQGILSLVRKDFEELSRLMTDWRREPEAFGSPAAGEGRPEGVDPLDRIVLYVDDLDRCRPSVVVQTLEAVHLLLALDLFVVVVAVDSRWLLRSLEVHYKDLLFARSGAGPGSRTEPGDEWYRRSTPQSYLEKIFQISFALAPMGPEGFERYVSYLAEPGDGAPRNGPAPDDGPPDGLTGQPEPPAEPAEDDDGDGGRTEALAPPQPEPDDDGAEGAEGAEGS